MADKKISQLDLVSQINNDAVVPMSQENGGEQTTYKALITALGAKIAEGMTFSNLATTAKNLVGAINEINAGGGGGGAAILIGTSTPSSSQGSNGNLYIQYTEGTGGADDTVDAIYVKLDGAWCEVETDYADLLNKPSINNNTLSGNKTNADLGILGDAIPMSTTEPNSMVADRIEACETAISGIPIWIKQAVGTSVSFAIPCTFFYYYADQWRAYVQFPFIAKNNNYSISLTSVQAENIGDITSKISVIAKYGACFEIETTKTMTALPNQFSVCVGTVNFTITFT